MTNRNPAGSRGAVMMEILLVGVVLSLISAALLASLLGAERTTRRAGHYMAAVSLGESIIESLRLEPDLNAGDFTWCPGQNTCPEGIETVQVEAEPVSGNPDDDLMRVTVRIARTGREAQNVVQVVSYVRQ